MSKYIINDSTLSSLADKIREKTNSTDTFTPNAMINRIYKMGSGDYALKKVHYDLNLSASGANSRLVIASNNFLYSTLYYSSDLPIYNPTNHRWELTNYSSITINNNQKITFDFTGKYVMHSYPYATIGGTWSVDCGVTFKTITDTSKTYPYTHTLYCENYYSPSNFDITVMNYEVFNEGDEHPVETDYDYIVCIDNSEKGLVSSDGTITSWNELINSNKMYVSYRTLLQSSQNLAGDLFIPYGIKSINQRVFAYQRNLTSVSLPEGITSIENNLFFTCTNMKSIVIPKSVTNIYYGAFNSCTSLTDVYYTGTAEQWNAITIGTQNIYLTNATIHYNYIR